MNETRVSTPGRKRCSEPMNRYASKTVVGEDRSRAEIEKLLMRFGADQFAYATDEGQQAAAIQFRYRGLVVRMTLALPSPDDPRITETPRGRRRSPCILRTEYERERRRRWRALALAIKAKLVAVEEGITTFEIEWLPYVLWGDGRTTAEHLLPAMAAGVPLPATPRALLPGHAPAIKGEIVGGKS